MRAIEFWFQRLRDSILSVLKEAEALRAQSKAAIKEQLEALKDGGFSAFAGSPLA